MHHAYTFDMAGRNSSATERAIAFVLFGYSIREAARRAGVAPSTVFRAIKRAKNAGSERS